MERVFQKTIGNERLIIERDEYVCCPIGDWDMMGEMFSYSGGREMVHAEKGRYYRDREDLCKALASELDDSFDETLAYWSYYEGTNYKMAEKMIEGAYALAFKKAIILEVHLNQCGISVYPFDGDIAGSWDGLFVCPLEKVKKEYSVKIATQSAKGRAERCMRSDLNAYDHYLSGDVYGFAVIKLCECCQSEGDFIDSCCGFYGQDWKENGIMYHVDEKFHQAIIDDDNEV